MSYTLTDEQYEALVTLAQQGQDTPDKQRALEAWLKQIEQQNGVQRFVLFVRWQEANTQLPPSAIFPTSWPPTLQAMVQIFGRAVAQADVDAMLKVQSKSPVGILVTPDVGGLVGWSKYEDYFGRAYQR